MSYSVGQCIAELEAAIHGTTFDKVANPDGLFYRAARGVLADVDLQETKRIALMANPIFSQVYDYALPPDVKGNRIIDIRPQVNRSSEDRFTQQYNQEFDLYKTSTTQDSFSLNFNTGIKTLRVNDPLQQAGLTLNTAESVTENGTWITGDAASTLSVDNINFVGGVGSLKFNLNGGTDGYLQNSTMTQQDLTQYLNQGTLFYYVYLPTASAFSSIELRWGSDASNYWKYVSTMTQQNTVFVNGWNLIAVPWASAMSRKWTISV
jgi:hypothetical protein